MSTTDPNSIPSLAASLLHSYAQKGVTAAATFLVTKGLLTTDQQGQFVTLGVGVAMFAASCLWTFIRDKISHDRQASPVSK